MQLYLGIFSREIAHKGGIVFSRSICHRQFFVQYRFSGDFVIVISDVTGSAVFDDAFQQALPPPVFFESISFVLRHLCFKSLDFLSACLMDLTIIGLINLPLLATAL
jgi:hypothetical protein